MNSEDVLRALLELLPQSIFWVDANMEIVDANRSFREASGFENVAGKTAFDMPISREDAERFYRGDLEILQGSKSELNVLQKVIANDEERWNRVSRKPIRDREGRIIGIVGAHLDITDQMRAEAEAGFLRSLIESSTDPIYALDPTEDWKLVYVNDALCRHFGYSREKLLSLRIPDWDLEFDIAKLNNFDPKDEKLVKFLSLFESRHRLADGRVIPVEISSSLFEHNGKTYCGGVFRDISQRKEIELRLRLQGAALESAANAIAITDSEGEIRWVNPAFCKLTGYFFEEVIGRNTRFLKSGKMPSSFYDEMWATIRKGKVWKGELVNRRKNGGLYDEEMTIAPVRDAGGNITHFVAIKQDISDRKQAEIELARARDAALESTRLKSEFLANMSHEIRTPMNAILGMNALLLDTPLTPEQLEFARTVQSSAEALLTLLNDILDFSKIEAGKLSIESEDFDLAETLEDVIDLLAETAQAKGIELAGLLLPGVQTRLHGDSGRIKQVLLNLVGNAVKFTEHGEVVVRVTEEGREEKRVTLRFEIEDTGIGIPEPAQAKLFQAFTQVDGSITRRYGGTGLGLAISQRLVELMGGQIGIKKSKPDRGSVFWFTLQAENAHTAVTVVQPKPGNLAGLQVLVVDDNPTNGLVLHYQLANWGLLDSHASGGVEALRMLREHAASGSPFQLAILDMQMPGMDGLTLARAIKADPAISNTRKVLLTSFGTKPDARIAREAGIAESLLKPVRHARLFDCLTRVLTGFSKHSAVSAKPDIKLPEPVPPSGEILRILLAEDNVVNQKVILLQLKKLGYQARVAANGNDVLTAIDHGSYDLILMDCQMPEMEGSEATRRIREKERNTPGNPHIYIIALTAHAMEGYREQCLASGMDDYLSKPLRLGELAAALNRGRVALERQCAGSPPGQASKMP